MSEENKNSTNDNQGRESTEKEILIDNNDEKPEINASNIEESLIKEINKDIPKTTKRYFGIDLIRVVACFLVMQTHAGEIYYIEDSGDLIRNEKNTINN